MKTWDDYKRHVKDISDQDRRNMEEIEEAAAIVASLIRRRQELGLSQRALAERLRDSAIVCRSYGNDENAAEVGYVDQDYPGPQFKIAINSSCVIKQSQQSP